MLSFINCKKKKEEKKELISWSLGFHGKYAGLEGAGFLQRKSCQIPDPLNKDTRDYLKFSPSSHTANILE